MGKQGRLTKDTITMIANRFRVLSDPMRLQILHTLQGGEMSVMEIVAETDTSQPNVSKHLRLLQDAGLVLRRQQGNLVYYRVADESIFEMCDAVCDSLKRHAQNTVSFLP